MFDTLTYLKTKQINVEAALKASWVAWEPYPTHLVAAMRYSLEAGGKRLRPILCIAASEAVGGTEQGAMPAACALEFIHTYSLIHDDLPAMDNDDLRRGKPTCHKAFDEATAILAGDGLLTAAFEILAEAGSGRTHDASKWLQVVKIISAAAGPSGMVQGQMMDLLAEAETITLEELATMHRLKTGALIQASVITGALLGGGTPRQVTALAQYGGHVGVAFQLADDILNVEGSAEALGKPVGNDAASGKATAASLMGLDHARDHARKLVHKALQALEILDKKAEPLAAIGRYMIERNQ